MSVAYVAAKGGRKIKTRLANTYVRARQSSEVESAMPLVLGAVGAFLLYQHFRDDVTDSVVDTGSDYVKTMIHETTSNVVRSGVSAVSGGADAMITGASDAIYDVAEPSHARVEDVAGRSPGSYDKWLKSLPLGFGTGIAAADAVWEWQAKYTHFRPHDITARYAGALSSPARVLDTGVGVVKAAAPVVIATNPYLRVLSGIGSRLPKLAWWRR